MKQLKDLRGILSGYGRVVVAFSGGVDSGLLAWVAHDTLGAGRALAATAVSPSLAPAERDHCRRIARQWGLDHIEMETHEVDLPDYTANNLDRCYHCKAELMDRLAPLASELGAEVALGVNLDDLDEVRPGQRAAGERGAVFPLVEAGFTKADVRAAARHLGLGEIAEKPAAPCLASRVPYGTAVTMGTLSRVARAEEALRRLGFADLRVRHYGDLARIELPVADLDRALADRGEVVAAVRSAGYRYVTLDLEGLRSGNLNASTVGFGAPDGAAKPPVTQ